MKQVLLLISILIVGFSAIFALSKTMERVKPNLDESYIDEDLYFSATQLSAYGHDFRGLIADWYWVNSLQYLGNKALKQETINVNDLRPLNPRLLYPMLDTAVTLDPQFMTVYSYGAAVLPAIDAADAIKLLGKGIAANPDNWRLYHNLGYIYWQIKDYQKAGELYSKGASKQDAPDWMIQMSANMQAQGGNREFALEIYRQMYETADDENTKSFAELRYMQIESLIEREAIRPVLHNFKSQSGRCVNSWREVAKELVAVKLKDNKPLSINKDFFPLDPTGVPYLIVNQEGKCDVDLDLKNSKIPANKY